MLRTLRAQLGVFAALYCFTHAAHAASLELPHSQIFATKEEAEEQTETQDAEQALGFGARAARSACSVTCPNSSKTCTATGDRVNCYQGWSYIACEGWTNGHRAYAQAPCP